MTRSRLRTLVRSGAVLGLVALTACTSSLRPNNGGSIGDIIGNVTDASGTVTAVFVEGDRPDPGAGPTATPEYGPIGRAAGSATRPTTPQPSDRSNAKTGTTVPPSAFAF